MFPFYAPNPPILIFAFDENLSKSDNIVHISVSIIEDFCIGKIADLRPQLNWAMQGVLSEQERQPGGQGRQM